MSKISIYLEEDLEKQMDKLIELHPKLTKRNRSSLFNMLLRKEIEEQNRMQMIEGAIALDELDLGWSGEEEYCAIIDMEVSG